MGAFLHAMRSVSVGKAVRTPDGTAGEPLWSHLARWDELLVPVSVDASRAGLRLDDDRPLRWSVEWRTGKERVCRTVRELGQGPVVNSDPVRWFSWRRGQRHRPGPQFMVSTGRLMVRRAWRRPGCCWRWTSREI